MNVKSSIEQQYVFYLVLFLVLPSIVSAITDSDLSNNQMTVTVNVVETRDMPISFVHFAEHVFDVLNPGYDTLVEEQREFINKTFPISDYNTFNVRSVENPLIIINNLNESGEIVPGDKSTIPMLLSGFDRALALTENSRAVGIVSTEFSDKYLMGYAGITSRSGNVKSSFVAEKRTAADYKGATAAHEMGHINRFCDEYNKVTFLEDDGNKTYPSDKKACPNGDQDEDGQLDSECIDTYGISGLMGCPIENETLIIDLFYSEESPSHLINLYGDRNQSIPRWVNNATYSHLLNELKSSGGSVYSTDPLIVLAGTITNNFVAALENFYTLPRGHYQNRTFFESSNQSILKIVSKDQFGNVVQQFSQLIDFYLVGDGGNLTEVDEMPFVFVVPLGNATSFEFINQSNNVTLAVRNVTPNTPAVNITYPTVNVVTEDPFNITWNSSDADGDEVYVAVLISDDNGSEYSTLDLDLNQSYYEVDPDNFPAGSRGVIKLLGTDGINTGTNVSDMFYLGNGLNVTSATVTDVNDTRKVFEFGVENIGQDALDEVRWNLKPGDNNTVNSTENTTLEIQEDIFIFIEYDYPDDNEYNATATMNTSIFSKTEDIAVNEQGIEIIDLKLVSSNQKTMIFEFIINSLGEQTVNWTLNTGETTINADQNINLSANENTTIIIQYTYENTGTYEVTASTESENTTITINVNEFTVDNLKRIYSESPNIFEFEINNNIGVNITNISWTCDMEETTINSDQNITLENTTLIYVQYNYTSPGTYSINCTATNQTVMDYEEVLVEVA